jgi:hypothetical protein
MSKIVEYVNSKKKVMVPHNSPTQRDGEKVDDGSLHKPASFPHFTANSPKRGPGEQLNLIPDDAK